MTKKKTKSTYSGKPKARKHPKPAAPKIERAGSLAQQEEQPAAEPHATEAAGA